MGTVCQRTKAGPTLLMCDVWARRTGPTSTHASVSGYETLAVVPKESYSGEEEKPPLALQASSAICADMSAFAVGLDWRVRCFPA